MNTRSAVLTAHLAACSRYRLLLPVCILFLAMILQTGPVSARHNPGNAPPDLIPPGDAHGNGELENPVQLPDLRTLPPSELELQILGSRIKRLRFTNTIWNGGPGDLDMRASIIDELGVVQVTQYLWRQDGSSEKQQAGVFDFHAAHGHWHWEGFSIYRVWSLDRNGSPMEVVASSDKIGYCLIDVDRYRGTQASPFLSEQDVSEGRQYTGCNWARQGLSAGWTDSYRAHLAGQFVEVGHLSTGTYALQSVVDPDNIIRELNESNNAVRLYFRLGDEGLEVLGERYFPATPLVDYR